VSTKKHKDKKITGTPFPLDAAGTAIVTFLEPGMNMAEIRLMNVSAWARGMNLPTPDKEQVMVFDFNQLNELPLDKLLSIVKVDVEKALQDLCSEKLIAVSLQNIPGVTLRTFCPDLPAGAGAVQWAPEDRQKLLDKIQEACKQKLN
jgi:hypothetical protein